ncbi:hypothetical protein BH23BAC1_BH23BAC1_23830 [soil metagenome]
MNHKNYIKGGIYLIIDPSQEHAKVIKNLEQLVSQPIAAVQIWDILKEVKNAGKLIGDICKLCHDHGIPVLINNRWENLHHLPLDGVHFDQIPNNLSEIRKEINRDFICGITCNNDLKVVKWAEQNRIDYISFCSIFPSSTSNSCELVSFDTIKKARKITSMPIFLAGGIKPENIANLKELPYNGIAVVSGIMSAAQPDQALNNYHKKIMINRNENINH